MSFHFKKKESPIKAIRRLSRERIEKALGHLRKRDRLEVVHSVRKEIKKVRATLELVRDKLNEGTCRKRMKTLRVAAKCLRNPRDAHVRFQALERLVARFQKRLPAQPFPGIKKILRRDCHEESREFKKGKSVATADRMLRKLNRRIGDLNVKADGWPAIRSGLKRSYRCGQKAFQAALEDTSPENLHQWRKHVQDLWNQLRLLIPIHPKKLRGSTNKMRTLSQCLGDYHDLVILRRFVTRRCAHKHAAEAESLNELIDLRQKELRSAAFVCGAHIYAEKPSLFCRRLERDWHAWRAGQDTRSQSFQ
jgi:CHAD domain-containing protein